MDQLLSKFKKNFKNPKSYHVGDINPHLHWNMLLVVFIVVILGMTCSSFYLLYQIKKGEVFQNLPKEIDNTNKIIKNTLLDKVQKSFDDKGLKTESLLNQNSGISDPSI